MAVCFRLSRESLRMGENFTQNRYFGHIFKYNQPACVKQICCCQAHRQCGKNKRQTHRRRTFRQSDLSLRGFREADSLVANPRSNTRDLRRNPEFGMPEYTIRKSVSSHL